MNTKATEMLGKIQVLVEKGAVSEEMTSHPIMTGTLMNIPNNYRGLAKVSKILDGPAKGWMGMDFPIYVDMESGESNLLTPMGSMATVADISRWFD